MPDYHAATVCTLLFKNNNQKSCHKVFRHKNRNIKSDMTLNSQILMMITECKYLCSVLSDGVLCTKDVEIKIKFL